MESVWQAGCWSAQSLSSALSRNPPEKRIPYGENSRASFSKQFFVILQNSVFFCSVSVPLPCISCMQTRLCFIDRCVDIKLAHLKMAEERTALIFCLWRLIFSLCSPFPFARLCLPQSLCVRMASRSRIDPLRFFFAHVNIYAACRFHCSPLTPSLFSPFSFVFSTWKPSMGPGEGYSVSAAAVVYILVEMVISDFILLPFPLSFCRDPSHLGFANKLADPLHIFLAPPNSKAFILA